MCVLLFCFVFDITMTAKHTAQACFERLFLTVKFGYISYVMSSGRFIVRVIFMVEFVGVHQCLRLGWILEG